jgi:hypothetical protein
MEVCVSFMSRKLYLQGWSPQYPLDRRLGEPQSWSGCCEVQKNVFLLPVEIILTLRRCPLGICARNTILTGFCTLIWSFQVNVGLTPTYYRVRRRWNTLITVDVVSGDQCIWSRVTHAVNKQSDLYGSDHRFWLHKSSVFRCQFHYSCTEVYNSPMNILWHVRPWSRRYSVTEAHCLIV